MTLRKIGPRAAKLAIGATLLAASMAACSIGGSDATPTAITGTPTPTPKTLNLSSPTPIGPPPAAATVDATTFVMIDQWRAYQVPKYPGTGEGKFTQLGATTVQNGGTLVFSTNDSPEDVLAYYRSALPFLGWKEITANTQKVSYRTDKASVTVSATAANGSTSILIILGDV